MKGFCPPEPEDVWSALGRPVDETQRVYLEGQLAQAQRKLTLMLMSKGVNVGVVMADPLKGPYFRDLIVDSVTRMERNPAIKEGLQSETEGDYSYSMANARVVAANLWWPDDELAPLLTGVTGSFYGTLRTPLMQRTLNVGGGF